MRRTGLRNLQGGGRVLLSKWFGLYFLKGLGDWVLYSAERSG